MFRRLKRLFQQLVVYMPRWFCGSSICKGFHSHSTNMLGPGRTDNEIKNYWRTHMRKQAQEKKQEISQSPSSSSSLNSYSSSSNSAAVNSITATEKISSFQSMGTPDRSALQENKYKKDENKDEELYSMDDIWKDITSDEPIKPVYDGYSEGSSFSCPPITSPLWEYSPHALWRMEEDGTKILFSANDQFVSCYQDRNVYT